MLRPGGGSAAPAPWTPRAGGGGGVGGGGGGGALLSGAALSGVNARGEFLGPAAALAVQPGSARAAALLRGGAAAGRSPGGGAGGAPLAGGLDAARSAAKQERQRAYAADLKAPFPCRHTTGTQRPRVAEGGGWRLASHPLITVAHRP